MQVMPFSLLTSCKYVILVCVRQKDTKCVLAQVNVYVIEHTLLFA